MSDDKKIIDLRDTLRPKPIKPASGDGGGEDAPRKHGEIWDGCPVQALGVMGDHAFYLDTLGQLRAVDNHTKDRMRSIFGGRTDWLMERYPSYSKGSNAATGWAQEAAAAAMMRACAERGVWDAERRTRGRGAWLDDEGHLILHCGDSVFLKGVWTAPGRIGDYVYPSESKAPRPLQPTPKSGADNPGARLFEVLKSWSWERGDLDAYLLFGWILGAMVGGALKWRPMCWVTGDAGSGKSTIHELVRAMLSEEWMVYSSDPTEAGVRQLIDQSSVPVLLDEAEPRGDDNSRINGMVALARQAASGGVVLRGGSNHKGKKFQARSAFMFSSILVPGMLDQDIQRMALLRLNPLRRDSIPPEISSGEWRKSGRGILARLVDLWPSLHTTLEIYRAALARVGHGARGCDQFGTILAMAHLGLYDTPPTPEEADVWARRLPASELEDAGMTDWMRMINHLMSSDMPGIRSGMNHSVGAWIDAATALQNETTEVGVSSDAARAALRDIGLAVKGVGPAATLTMANCHSRLSRLFEGTQWSGGGGRSGVWAQAAARIPGAQKTGPVRFGGGRITSRAVAFPLASIEGGAAAEPPPPARDWGADDFS